MPVQLEIRGPHDRPISPLIGCLPMALAFLLMCLIPLAMYDVGKTAMLRLGLEPFPAMLALLGIFFGSLINIPVKEFRRDELQPEVQFGPIGMVYPRTYKRVQSRTLIAVNLGGCVIPVLLAVMQIGRLANIDSSALVTASIVSLISIVTCYRIARPVEGVGILLPGFVPPILCVICTWILLLDASADQRAATAFTAGVLGPVIGADLLHLRKIIHTPVGIMSIGGAGTFDGIVLSGILSALLA